MSQPNISIKQSQADPDRYDVELEHVVIHSNPSDVAVEDIIIEPDGIDDAAGAKKERRSMAASLLVNKKTAAAAAISVFSAGAIMGASIIGIGAGAEQKRQQKNALAAITNSDSSNSKSGKSASAPFCETEEPDSFAVNCGDIFNNNETVVLTQDILCTDNVADATTRQLRILNAAIKLEGAGAIIDCQGHTISQLTSKYAPHCDSKPRVSFGPTIPRGNMKKDCDLFYQGGIWLVGGATAINCNVENFYDGFLIEKGGEVQKSNAKWNRDGVEILDDSGSTTRISDMYLHNNGIGIRMGTPNGMNTVIIEDVTSKYNVGDGMALRNVDITVKDSTTSYNGQSGIKIIGEAAAWPTKVTFEGTVSSHHNKIDGIDVGDRINNEFVLDPPWYAQVNVNGVLNTYLNGKDGLFIYEDVDMQGDMYVGDLGFTVEAGGSVNSCNNNGTDIFNDGTVNFVDEGTDGYTCDDLDGSGSGLPACVACPSCN